MKKPNRRGRPPGSKSASSVAKPGTSVANMELSHLRDHIGQLQETLASKIQQQREFFESQLAGLRIYANNKSGAAVRSVMQVPANTRERAPVKPKYRSKKHKRLKWSGRGLMPKWMVEEMKGTKLTKEDFLIK